MHLARAPRHAVTAAIAMVLMTAVAAPSAFAIKNVVLGPVAFDVPDDFSAIAGPPPALHQEASGITVEVSALPPQALQEFKGPSFLEFLASLGYANAAYAEGALKRTDTYTYVLADAKGAQGPESRFLLVLGGAGRAAIITAYVAKSQIDNGRASRAGIEAILSTASITPASGATR